MPERKNPTIKKTYISQVFIFLIPFNIIKIIPRKRETDKHILDEKKKL
jgi:hypothetical protein